jgi:topoisomerase IA-like protein
MSLRSGSYGPYILHGSPGGGDATFHNFPDSYVERMTPELAAAICELPRVLGDHPAVGAPITLGMDREGMFVRVGIAPTKTYFPQTLTSPADLTLEDALSVLPDDVTVHQLQPTKLGDHQKKPVYAGLHKRVAYVVHGDAAPVYLPQNSIDGLTLEQAVKYIQKPPKFRSFRSSSRTKRTRKG